MANKLKEVALLFFRLGATAFGGPAAHIAMMEDEVVKKRKWISSEHFLDLIGATNLIPGPNSTEMTMHCGHERAGWKGLIVAGACFIFPAVVITMVFSWLYAEYGELPDIANLFFGIKPAVIAIILSTVYRLGKKALKSIELGILGALTLTACLLGVHEMIALFSCGLLGLLLYFVKQPRKNANSFTPLFILQIIGGSATFKIFFTFLKVGALLYGGGFVLFPYLNAELVATGIMTNQELMDAIAVGQFTPGPILTTATFVGWQLGGFWGSVVATLGIFIPSFIFVAILNPYVSKMRKSNVISSFLDAVNIAAVAIIIAVCLQMGIETLVDWRAILIAVLSIVIVFKFKKVNTAYIVVGGAILGYLLMLI